MKAICLRHLPVSVLLHIFTHPVFADSEINYHLENVLFQSDFVGVVDIVAVEETKSTHVTGSDVFHLDLELEVLNAIRVFPHLGWSPGEILHVKFRCFRKVRIRNPIGKGRYLAFLKTSSRDVLEPSVGYHVALLRISDDGMLSVTFSMPGGRPTYGDRVPHDQIVSAVTSLSKREGPEHFIGSFIRCGEPVYPSGRICRIEFSVMSYGGRISGYSRDVKGVSDLCDSIELRDRFRIKGSWKSGFYYIESIERVIEGADVSNPIDDP